MAGTRHPSILHYLRHVLGAAASGVGDAELLRRFVDQGDEAAFELLMWRHAAMVLHVCRQVLGDEQRAEDAFQATFLIFVRKASSISRREALGSWLYRVAYRIALKSQAEIRKRKPIECDLNEQELPAPEDNPDEREQRRIVAEEVHRLPAKFRAAIVSCYFESKTLEEASQQLGWPRGTVASRLSRGRELLRRRLLQRGITLPAGIVAAASVSSISAASTRLIPCTLQAAKQFAASAAKPTRAAALAEGVLQAMYWTRMKIVAVVLLLVGLGGAGATIWALPNRAEFTTEDAPPAEAKREDDKEQQRTDKLAHDMAQSRLNLRKLALAMIDHADKNKGFMPPPALINKDGKAVLSWRVLILPYLGERDLYEQFKLSEPWDGPNNKKLLSKMPAVFAPPGVKTPEPYTTFYQVFVSPKPKDGRKAAERGGSEIQAAFVQGQPQLFPAHFSDGLSQTILIIEAAKAVAWTQPADLPYAADKPLPELGGMFADVFHTAFANGDVHSLTKKIDEKALHAVITSNGLEPAYFDKIMVRSAAEEWQIKNGELRQDLEDARDRLRMLQEERGTLLGRPGAAKRSAVADAHLEELKKENARLQKEMEKLREAIKDESEVLNDEIQTRLRKPAEKKGK
jgi:RNA polymerase sigma factor (sigma-70 family)